MSDGHRNRPPWILFTDQGKPMAILPAGRPGEVANVEGLSIEAAQAIVNAANSAIDVERDLDKMLAALTPVTYGDTGDELKARRESPVIAEACRLLADCQQTTSPYSPEDFEHEEAVSAFLKANR